MKSTANRSIDIALLGLILLFVIVGCMTAIQTGIGWDEAFEQKTVALNLKAIKGLLAGEFNDYRALTAYQDKYYGIAFHMAALPLQALLAPLAERYLELSSAAAFLLPKHLLVFALFALSAIYFFRLLLQFLDDRRTCRFLTLLYCFCPYFLGHGTMNIKDAPFMAVWLICMHMALLMAGRMASGDRASWKPFIDLGFVTGLLMSIRLAGILVFAIYGLLLVVLLMKSEQGVGARLRELWPRIAASAVIALVVTWIAYPVLWLEPWRLAEAIQFMAAHPWSTCTLTAGACMPSQDLPASYIPIWLAVKLPLMALFGLALLPIVLARMSGGDFRRERLVVLIAGHAFILLVLAASGANLYSELRQVLFVMPVLLLVGVCRCVCGRARARSPLARPAWSCSSPTTRCCFPTSIPGTTKSPVSGPSTAATRRITGACRQGRRRRW
jgi:hypothetical protein